MSVRQLRLGLCAAAFSLLLAPSPAEAGHFWRHLAHGIAAIPSDLVETPARTYSSVIAEARRYMGGNPTGQRSNWCGDFANLVLRRSGHRSVRSRMAGDLIHAGRRISRPVPGAIVILGYRGHATHVGFVEGADRQGNPLVLSGNHSHRVGEGVYPRSRVLAYILPEHG